MLLEKLYTQFQKGDKPLFGSRFYNFLGRTFIGRPQDVGLTDLRPDLEQQFYFIPTDRKPPDSKAAFEAWSKASRQPNLKRVSLHPQVARGTYFVVVIGVLLLGTATGFVYLGKVGMTKAGAALHLPFSASPTAQDASASASVDLAMCNDLNRQLIAGTLSRGQIEQATLQRCTELMQGGK